MVAVQSVHLWPPGSELERQKEGDAGKEKSSIISSQASADQSELTLIVYN